MQSSNKPICTVIIENNKKEKKLFHTNVCRLLHFNTICSWFEPLDLPRYLPELATACGRVTVFRNKEDEETHEGQLLCFVYCWSSATPKFKTNNSFSFISLVGRPHFSCLCCLYQIPHQNQSIKKSHISHIYIYFLNLN